MRFIAFFLFILPLHLSSQTYKTPLNIVDGKVIFDKVVQTQNVSKSEAFANGREWIADVFKSAKDVIQYEDKEAGRIIAKGWARIKVNNGIVPTTAKMFFTLKLLFKEGRSKFIITDIYYKSDGDVGSFDAPCEKWIIDEKLYKKNGKPKRMQKSFKESTVEAVKDLFSQYKAIVDVKESDDW